MHSKRPGARERVCWTFADCVFDEGSWQLVVDGNAVEIENKPLQILLELLHRCGEVVTRQELLELVWPGLSVVAGSLSTAISKLRKALGDKDSAIIATVPRFGYRLAVPVTRQITLVEALDLALSAGDRVPRRPQWVLEELVRQAPDRETWTAVHEKTGEKRVFKLTADGGALRALKREVAVARLLRSALGDRPDFAAVFEWNFEEPLFFTEAAWVGPALPDWSEQGGGIAAVSMAHRIAFMAAVCETVAAAQGVGTVHRDIKPSNILVRMENGTPQPCVVDFGSAGLLDPSIARQFEVTWTGEIDDPQGSQGTSVLWLAPEVARGGPSTTASDVYSLGVLLYQMVVGDLMRPLAPGWESDIGDPLLQEDIAAAANGDPERRLANAAALAQRLRGLESRRAEAARIADAAARARNTAERLKRVQARRPWLITSLVVLVLGTVTSSLLYARAAKDRDEAERQRMIAEQVADFLGTDVLGQTSPYDGAGPDETLIAATKRVMPMVARRFVNEPQVAAELYQKIALALDQRSDFDGSREAFDQAVRFWNAAGEDQASFTRIAMARWGGMEARSQQADGLANAEKILADIDRAMVQASANAEETVWVEALRGAIAFAKGDMDAAEDAHEQSLAAAAKVAGFDPTFELGMRNRLALIHLRKGDAQAAEQGYREVAQGWRSLEGQSSPSELVALSLRVQALNMLGRSEEALAEAERLLPMMRQSPLGSEHLFTLLLESARVGFLAAAERYADVARVGPSAYRLIASEMGAESATAIDLLKTLALSQCRAGSVGAGLADAARARISAAKLGDSGIQGGADYAAADCALINQDLERATALFRGIDREAVAAATGEPDWGGMVELGLARVAAAQGDRAKAARHLEAAEPAFANAGDFYEARLWRQLKASNR